MEARLIGMGIPWWALLALIHLLSIAARAADILPARKLQTADQRMQPWPKFMRDNANSGYNPASDTSLTVDSPIVQWKYTTFGQITASPVIDSDGNIYVGSYDQNMYGLTSTGSLRWKTFIAGNGRNKGNYVSSTVALDPTNKLYFGDWNGYFYCYSSDGVQIWQFDASAGPTPQILGAIVSSPVIDTTLSEPLVYYGSDNAFVTCLDLAGRKKWDFKTGQNGPDMLFAPSDMRVQAPVALGLTGLSAGNVYVGSFDKFFYCINAATGTQVWRFPGRSVFRAGAAISPDGNTIYVGEANSAGALMYALNAKTGALRWDFLVINAIWETPAVDLNGDIYFPTQSSRFYALSAMGSLKWSATLGEQGTTSPALTANGVLYFGCSDSNVIAMRASDGSQIWKYSIALAMGVSASTVSSSVAIDADGALYFGADDFNIYKIVNAPPTALPTVLPTTVPTPTEMAPPPTFLPTRAPTALPSTRTPTSIPTFRSTPAPTPTPTSATPTAFPTFMRLQALSETAVVMGDCPNSNSKVPSTFRLDTVPVTFRHLNGPNKFWFLTVYIYGTGVHGSDTAAPVFTTLGGQLVGNQMVGGQILSNPDPREQAPFTQDPNCFCTPGTNITDCPNPLPAYRSSILNFNVTASMINPFDFGSIVVQTYATGFCRSACPYQGLYDLYVRYKLSGSLPGPTFQPTMAGVRPTSMPTARPTRNPTQEPTPRPTTPFPTAFPTPAPTTSLPTPNPTLMPTFFKVSQGPTLIVTTPRDKNALPLICPAFSVTGTREARDNFAECQIYACPGQSFTVGNCINNSPNAQGLQCQGDQFLRLFALGYPIGKQEVASNDDFCGACSQITYTVPLSDKCMVYSIREGCFGLTACSGVMQISGDIIGTNAVRMVPIIPSLVPTPSPTAPTHAPTLSPTATPTLAPTYVMGSPTPEPTILPTNPTAAPSPWPTQIPTNPTPQPTNNPTMIPGVPTPLPTQWPTALPSPFPSPPPTAPPTTMPTMATIYCPVYTGSGVRTAAACGLRACGGVQISVSTCPSTLAPSAWCAGPTNLTLADSSGRQVPVRQDPVTGQCGLCAGFTVTTAWNAPCQTYSIKQSCMGSQNTCMGVTGITTTSPLFGAVQAVPFVPTIEPSVPPGVTPTPEPSALPTFTPTMVFGVPTPQPTTMPTSTVPPTVLPTALPTMWPSNAPTLPGRPTSSPTPQAIQLCQSFVATSTDTDNTNVQTCGISLGGICNSAAMTISTCPITSGAYCQGRTVLRLFDQRNVEQKMTLLPIDCGGCPTFSFTTAWNAPCQTYTLNQGCVMGEACAGTTAITNYAVNLANPSIITYHPTAAPTALPTAMPDVPTFAPTPAPSVHATLSSLPTQMPSPVPTAVPTEVPSAPSMTPSPAPTYLAGMPTPVPTSRPSDSPNFLPSAFPTTAPTTAAPTAFPTASPTVSPTQPTTRPTPGPTYLPNTPTPKPTEFPIAAPSPQPSSSPTNSPTLAPSMGPTFAPTQPSPLPTAAPSFLRGAPTPGPTTSAPSPLPSAVPSVVPTPLVLRMTTSFCPVFTTAGPANAPGKPVANLCGIYACPGTTFMVSMCASVPGTACAGNPALSLYAETNGTFVEPDMANAAPSCGSCPQFSYTPFMPCQIYVMTPGCTDNMQCGGKAAVMAHSQTVVVLTNATLLAGFNPPTPQPTSMFPTRKPSQFPSYLPGRPTPRPTLAPTTPTSPPTPAPTFPFICPPYSVNNTNSALSGLNSATCSFFAEPGQTVSMGSCTSINGAGISTCKGDEYIRLFNSQGDQLAFNDDGGPGCGQCSLITYTVPRNMPAQNYFIREGCYKNGACSGTPAVLGAIGAQPPGTPTTLPSAQPTVSANPTLLPTAHPTYAANAPTPSPSPNPTADPTMFLFGLPTTAPTFKPLLCPWFMAVNTLSDQRKFMTCSVYACPGTTFTVSTCQGNFPGASCRGDTYLQLFSAPDPATGDEQMLVDNDNGPGTCGLCSQFTFTATAPCQVYTINQGCIGMEGCSGDTIVAGNNDAIGLMTFRPTMRGTKRPTRMPTPEPTSTPTPQPSLWPTYIPKSPTPAPTSLPTAPSPRPSAIPTQPSPKPTMMPTFNEICPPFFVTKTSSNTVGYAVCNFRACSGATITMTSCLNPNQQGPACVGDQMYALYDQSGSLLQSNDDTCGLCSQISFTASNLADGQCQVYSLRQGCTGNSTCGGTTLLMGQGSFSLSNVASFPPTTAPVISPVPSFAPKVPTPAPTIAVTLMAQTTQLCPNYFAYGTSMDTTKVKTCGVYACPGTTFMISTCPTTPGAYCSGDSYLRLKGADGTLLAENDNGPSSAFCGSCSQLSFTATGPCQVYTIAEGCGTNRACSGVVGVTSTVQSVQVINFVPTAAPTTHAPSAIPTSMPTAMPDVPTVAPTPAPTSPTSPPTHAPPTMLPTAVATLPKFCPPFFVSNTNNARDGAFATCLIEACPGSMLTIGNCAGSIPGSAQPGPGCFGDQFIRLFDPSGKQVAVNDDFCGPCSQLSFNVSSYNTDATQCYHFVLREGCHEMGTCGGVMSVSGGVIVSGLPSSIPTAAPTLAYILGSPTVAPTNTNVMPTVGPTMAPLTCTEYVVGETNDNTVNFATCGIYACAGVTFEVSTCSDVPGAVCDGDTYLTLVNGNGTVVASNDDGANPACGLCAMFSFTTAGPCQVYSLREGCGGTDACRGVAAVSGSALSLAAIQIVDYLPTLMPTIGPTSPTLPPSARPSMPPSFGPSTAPSYIPYVPTPPPTFRPSSPTVSPTAQPSNPTFLPTLQPTYGQICPPYNAHNTASTTMNQAICGLYACGGTTLTISNCGDGCYGDQYLRLYDSVTSQQVSFGDDGCPDIAPGVPSLCSRMIYTVPEETTCRTYFIWEGCSLNDYCEGTVNFIGTGGQPAILQTSVPTSFVTPIPFMPVQGGTPRPSMEPTQAFVNAQFCLGFQGQRMGAGEVYPFCQVYACPGTTFTVSTCSQTTQGAFCFGDPYIKMYSAAGGLVAANDNGPGVCGHCAEVTYTSQETTCQLFTIKEGCQGNAPCSGTMAVVSRFGAVSLLTQGPTPAPVFLPDQGPPTVLPSALPTPAPSALPTFTVTPGPTTAPDEPSMAPTAGPSPLPTAHQTSPTADPTFFFPQPDKCTPFIGAMTNTTTMAVAQCAIEVCPGTTVVIGECDYRLRSLTTQVPGEYCIGDSFLRLFDNYGRQVATDDDYCGLCSQITLNVDGDPNPNNCVTYMIDQGCYGNSTCSGVTRVFGATVVPLPGEPTFFPTSSIPTPGPSLDPTSALPTTASPTNPTAVPTVVPSYLPNDPTPDPTVMPTALPSSPPSPHPSADPTAEPTFPPTPAPSLPSARPTMRPSFGRNDPTPPPSVMPSAVPTALPSADPTVMPTPQPSALPSADPTVMPTPQPSALPSADPTFVPGSPTPLPGDPTAEPTPLPTTRSTDPPTPLPSAAPSVMPTAIPSALPSHSPAPSTPSPSSLPTSPIPQPTHLPTTYAVVQCPSFDIVALTANGTRNDIACGLFMCAGTTVTIDNCPVPSNIGYPASTFSCKGDTTLRLFDEDDKEVAFNDDGPGACGKCSQLTYTVPGTEGSCAVWALNQGCGSNNPCGGQVQISAFLGAVTIVGLSPSLAPTAAPSSHPPSPAPTAHPSFSPAPSTVTPTVAPTPVPTNFPTQVPTLVLRPTRVPRSNTPMPLRQGARMPTWAPSNSWEGQDIYAEIGQVRPYANAGPALSAVNSSFGSVITFTGLMMIVGAPDFNAGKGMVEVFDCMPMMSSRSGSVLPSCTSVTVLQSSSGLQFGASIAAVLGGTSGALLAVGVPGVGGCRVDIFGISNPASITGTYPQRQGVISASKNPNYSGAGRSVPKDCMFGATMVMLHLTSVDPVFIVVGDYAAQSGSGVAYVYSGMANTLGVWSLAQTLSPNAGDTAFGIEMACSMQGLLVIGAVKSTGIVVYVFNLANGNSDTPLNTLGPTVVYPTSTSVNSFGFSLAITTDTLLLGVPTGGANLQGVAVVYGLGTDAVTRMPAFSGPLAVYVPDPDEYTGTGRSDFVQFGSTVAMATRGTGVTARSELAITCPGCGQADPRGSTYIYICTSPGNCPGNGVNSNTYIQRVYMDADQCHMDKLGPNGVAFTQTGSILGVGATPSFGGTGSLTIYNAAQFPFTSRPSPRPTLGPTPEPSRPPRPTPAPTPTHAPTPRATTVMPSAQIEMDLQMTIYLSLAAQGVTAQELKSALDYNVMVQSALTNAIIKICQGAPWLSLGNFLGNPRFITQLMPFAQRRTRQLQSGGPLYIMFQLTIPISGEGLKLPWLNDPSFAFNDLQRDFQDGLNANSGVNGLSAALRNICQPGTGNGCGGGSDPIDLSKAVLAPAPPLSDGIWVQNNGPMALTEAPTPELTASPTSPMPTAVPTIVPTTAMPTGINGAASLGTVMSNPTTLGGVAAGIVVFLIVVILAVRYCLFAKSKEDAQDLLDHEQAASDYNQQQHYDNGQPDYLQGDQEGEEFVERPSGGVEMLQNPMGANTDWGRRNTVPPVMLQAALEDAYRYSADNDNDSIATHDQDLPEGSLPPPPRRENDPYGRMSGAGPQRLSVGGSVRNPLVQGGSSAYPSFVPPPPPGMSAAGERFPVATREASKRFSVQTPQDPKFSGRLGSLAVPISPGAPPFLRPFQKQAPIGSPAFLAAAPRLAAPVGPQMNAPADPHVIIRMQPGSRLSAKLKSPDGNL